MSRSLICITMTIAGNTNISGERLRGKSLSGIAMTTGTGGTTTTSMRPMKNGGIVRAETGIGMTGIKMINW